MKVLGISIVMFILMTGLSIAIDAVRGEFGLKLAVKNTFNSFFVMDPFELVALIILVFFWMAVPIRSFYKEKKEQESKNKKQENKNNDQENKSKERHPS